MTKVLGSTVRMLMVADLVAQPPALAVISLIGAVPHGYRFLEICPPREHDSQVHYKRTPSAARLLVVSIIMHFLTSEVGGTCALRPSLSLQLSKAKSSPACLARRSLSRPWSRLIALPGFRLGLWLYEGGAPSATQRRGLVISFDPGLRRARLVASSRWRLPATPPGPYQVLYGRPQQSLSATSRDTYQVAIHHCARSKH